ncbi:hypothetical protein H6G04_34510 [Calothrix membranacea FACHB-236]|nr:hypothetical protein [Calothrix membranacea FACHB-236]
MRCERTTLAQQAIALFLSFSARRSHYFFTTGDRIIFELLFKAIALVIK